MAFVNYRVFKLKIQQSINQSTTTTLYTLLKCNVLYAGRDIIIPYHSPKVRYNQSIYDIMQLIKPHLHRLYYNDLTVVALA